jgi:hypothetical protein
MGARWCDKNLFKSPVYYGLCLTERSFLEEMKRLKVSNPPAWISNEHSDGTTHFFTKADGKLCAVVCLRINKGRNPVEIVGLLAHEGVHIWQEIKDRIGEHSPSKEFEAYSIQWIVQQLVDECAQGLKRMRF